MSYKVYIRFVQNGEYIGTEPYYLDIPDNTSEDNLMDALMDSAREFLEEENYGNEVWESGDVEWSINDFEKI